MTRVALTAVAAFLCFALAAPEEAAASHYDLSAIDIVDAPTAKRLAEQRVFTTEDLWKATATPKQISKLARLAGVRAKQLRELHDFCDLLRIGGVGPKLARVLTLCGVRNLALMAKEDPAALTRRIKSTNAQHSILGKLPDEDSVRTWIARAADLCAEAATAAKKAAGTKKATGAK
ncbi:MAG: DUF4332 domain-containing protein [Deltaproteobacteria bacterium]|nr:DUF4332 domain-containing protein [Deltaproteobacteria bacterium]